MGHIGGGQQLSSIPQHKVNQQKQMVNETIRRRISDKMLAQQQAQYRNNDSMPSPSSPGTPPVRSPESVDSYVMSPGSQQQLQHQFEQVTMVSVLCRVVSACVCRSLYMCKCTSLYVSCYPLFHCAYPVMYPPRYKSPIERLLTPVVYRVSRHPMRPDKKSVRQGIHW